MRLPLWGSAALAAAALAALPSAASAQANARGIEFFETKIRPVLVNNCYECHSAKATKPKGGLLLDSRDGVRKGGDTGPVIVPGKPGESLIVKSLHYHGDLKMPPKAKLPAAVIADFEEWIKLGAPDPREGAAAKGYKTMTLDEAKSFWAYQPPRKPKAPAVKDANWPRADLDRFVLAKLEERGLRPVADADRYALLRRLNFDLIGLPPSPAEIDDFVNDKAADAVEKVVDRLLASEHYGERWGRHWLDVARYAESNGNADNIAFPHAWRYRDYVIKSFNEDKRFDRFVLEQIAGDLLPAEAPEEHDVNRIATGFLALTSKPRAQNNPDFRMDLVADQIDVTTKAFLGLTVMCARCHDHKFDPVSTKEYYALAGIFDSTQMMFGAGVKGGGVKKVGAGGLYTLSTGSYAMGVGDLKPVDTAVCIRGESQRRGETVRRGLLAVAKFDGQPEVNRSQSGRLELARWIADPKHPLTARVMANRIWLHLFGEGIVRTPDNFGSLGEKPSHPELLDFLAARLVENGWSVKKTIREIVLSRTYRLASAHDAKSHKADPDNVLLWRMSPRRLEAEPIRDAILAAGGKLATAPPMKSLMTGAPGKKAPKKLAVETNHRAVYLPIVRNGMPELLDLFDVANPLLVMGKREVTTVPAQALYLMNNPWVVEQSRHMAQRLLDAQGTDDAGRVDLGYRLALSRPATDAERQRVLAYLRDAGGPTGWTNFCQTLFASAEFRYLR